VVVFGRGSVERVLPELGSGYVLLTGSRGAAAAALSANAATVVEVAPGRVDELAAALRPAVHGELLVAVGGGRVIDTAKALAAADPPRRVAAIPTTLSGAEMTAVHRQAADAPPGTRGVRPALVINDPALCASQPLAELAASAGNALGHAAEGPLTPLGNPVAGIAALEAARLLAAALGSPLHDGPPALDDAARDSLALGALLAGFVIGSTGYGLHHILSQTLVRFAGLGHGQANTTMLPVTLEALERRFPGRVLEPLSAVLGCDAGAFARRLCELAGVGRLHAMGVDDAGLDRCADEAAARPDLAMTPPVATRDELRALYEAAR
jgi:alcohol dehydrogenase class IV